MELEIDEGIVEPKAAEFGIQPAVYKVESESLVEVYRSVHVVNGERNLTDVLDRHPIFTPPSTQPTPAIAIPEIKPARVGRCVHSGHRRTP